MFGHEQILKGGMKTVVKIHFSGCGQSEVFISPLERAPDGGGALKENPLNLHLESQKAFTATMQETSPGKQCPGSWRWFVFSVDSEAAFPKAPQHTILKTTNKQQPTSRLMFFLMTFTSQLPWLNKNDRCISFASTSNTQKAITSKLHIYSDRQLVRCTTRSTEEKTFLHSKQNCVHEQGLLAKLQPFFVWLYPLYFKKRSHKLNSSNFSLNH